MITLKNDQCTVTIDEGELTSYIQKGHEYIHQKRSPGWGSSDTEMFPIIGPVADAFYQIQTEKGFSVQDQHGLLREMAYRLDSKTETIAVFKKSYTSGAIVLNSKFPKKSTEKNLFWPYDFEFVKTFELHENSLEITFTISGETGMPFMLGYHPAFKLHTKNPTVVAKEKTITLDEVLAVGSRALEISDCNEITLKDTNDLVIRTEGFGNFMLWTEVRNMLCIEPITFYPYAVAQKELHKGFQHAKGTPVEFKVRLSTKSH